VKILAIRHGEVDHIDIQSVIKTIEKNKEGVFPEPQLNPKGKKQIHELTKILEALYYYYLL